MERVPGGEPGEVTLQRPTGPVRWRRVAGLDMTRIQRQGDVRAVMAMLQDVAYGDVSERADAGMDPGLRNGLGMAQYTTQYLMGCSQRLRVRNEAAEQHLASAQAALEHKARESRKQRSTLRRLRRERAKCDELIENYKALVDERNRDAQEHQRAEQARLQAAVRRGKQVRNGGVVVLWCGGCVGGPRVAAAAAAYASPDACIVVWLYDCVVVWLCSCVWSC